MSKNTRRDVVHVLAILLVAVAGVASVCASSRILAWISILFSDSYLCIVLLFAALRSDDANFLNRHRWITHFFPRRTPGLLIVALLWISVLAGFAGLYLGNEVFASTKTPLDAIYTSVFTLALTDYSPKPGYGQIVVIGEVVSGFFLLVALFPLLISRISTFKNE